MQDTPDRRKQKTRSALLGAFNALFFESPDREIRVSDVTALAGVGRSTFYEHFAGVHDLYVHAMSHPMTILANAITGHGNADELVGLLAHLQENQRRARALLGGPKRQDATRVLTALLKERLAEHQPRQPLPRAAVILQLADGALGSIHGWLTGEIWCSKRELAETLIASSKALTDGLLNR